MNHEKVLGFNPVSRIFKALGLITITVEMAKYILKLLNKDNRPIKKGQVNSISTSIRRNGWLNDGQPLTFNTNGDITEFQHRLMSIIETGVEPEVPVIIGVEPDCFSKTATARTRTPNDEIARKVDDYKDSEVSTLREILKRKQDGKLTMQNCVELYLEWKQYIRGGEKLIDTFFDTTETYSSVRRVFGAWAALMYKDGQNELVSNFLDLLKDEILEDGGSTKLTKDFFVYYKEHSWDLPNTGRPELMYYLLCVASDRMSKKDNGEIELNVNPLMLTHDKLKNKGFYRKFLSNPQNLPKPPIELKVVG